MTNRLKKTLAACAILTVFGIGGLAPVFAGGETRTIALYHIHTGESLTVTYMKDGRYVPSAMKQINYLLRDWRRKQTVNIDPRTIDLVWELHEDMGSHAPVHIVCGYRSPQTNAFLHRIGRNVARESQHIQGKAIDFYFTDVPTIKIRNSALVRQVGGVGYYSSSGGPTGFLHVDSGNVRHWGPYISPSQMAQIFRDGQKYVGRRMNQPASPAVTEVATADAGSKNSPGIFSKLLGLGKKAPQAADPQVANAKPANAAANAALQSSQSDMADLSEDAAAAPAKPLKAGTVVSEAQMASLGELAQDAAQPPKAKAIKVVNAPLATSPAPAATVVADAGESETDVPDATVKLGRVVPKPRLKPIEIMLMAAANMKTEPKLLRINAASAPPPSPNGKDAPSPMADSLGTLMQAAAGEDNSIATKPVTKGKPSVTPELRSGEANGMPKIKPMIASAGGDINWWPQLLLQGEAAIRRNGKPPVIGALDQDTMPRAAAIDGGTGSTVNTAELDQSQRPADGKGDLMVSTQDKANLELLPLPLQAGQVANNQ